MHSTFGSNNTLAWSIHARTVAGETVSPYSWVMSCALRPSGNNCPSVRCTASARTFGAVLHNFSHAFGKLALLQLPTGAAQLLRAMFGDLKLRNRHVEHLHTLCA